VRAEAETPRLHPNRLALTWFGHSTTTLELDGATVLTDPILRRRVGHLIRFDGWVPPIPDKVDVILVSHAHRDHLDLASLRSLPRSAALIVPKGAGRTLAKLGFRDVIELVEGARVAVAGLRVQATHAEHARGRGLRTAGPTPLGYVVRGSLTAYFAGDTDLFEAMASLEPRLDLALLPISGWGARLPAGHLDAARAARALQLIGPRVAVPIHWGTLRPFYRAAPYDADASAAVQFAALAHAVAPRVEVRILRPGERCTIGVDNARGQSGCG
jgi:L-ascorbate metabolism protein UlaG (beta-lactamase superfamily)